jgi:V-type H+-transporting ATPase subunit G
LNEEEADELDRTKRVKEARDEAKKEIDEYKKNKEEEFKKFESEVRSLC